jgi:hypothetical protein
MPIYCESDFSSFKNRPILLVINKFDLWSSTNRDEKGVGEDEEERKKRITGEKRKKGRKKKGMFGNEIFRMKGRKKNKVRNKYEGNMEI